MSAVCQLFSIPMLIQWQKYMKIVQLSEITISDFAYIVQNVIFWKSISKIIT